ncbi:MAG: ATPase [Spirochaetes bacterium GWF1_31_7]|nr:MAG: ATPase [Spirochaetes bacterium GWE1_32_154]OHD46368.1 MAG: ATPase [Spirochaetes bacterium GWE2_31_10]OHD47747.1 MAG: ATPase [Spirochaetes bacterium GWF1_31_7]OHD81327.1 MAG: ATPase [Spirochaetes bacterium RIFOXYB1_FULL_32_8]HBD95595.1 ATPase [Spirochaetia bacterium]
MVSDFISIYKRLLQHINFSHHRYIYKYFNLNNRLTGLIGPRGTGKTTLLLQYIKENLNIEECIYTSLDNIYFTQNNLIEFVNELYDFYGIRYFFFDETHKYPNWNQELKNLYDSYPDIKIVFSGSSSLDLTKGAYDLSRRGVLYKIGGMSFREYLLFNNIADIPSFTFEELLHNRSKYEADIGSIKMIPGHFKNYIGNGYYPFILEDPSSYSHKIQRIIEKTIYEDISNHYKLKTENLINFKRIISYLATIPPGELNKNNISKNSGLDNKTVQHYLDILQETGLIQMIIKNQAGSTILKKTEKIFLDNTDLYKSVSKEIGFETPVGTLREIFFIKMILNSGNTIHYSETGDYSIQDIIFEIGGKNKTLKQIKHTLENSFLVKDDIVFGSKYEIPLYLFGFLY